MKEHDSKMGTADGGSSHSLGAGTNPGGRQTLTLNAMPPLMTSQDPYGKYSSQDRDSVDDGINLDLSQEEGSEGAMEGEPHTLPSLDVIHREFRDYVEAMSPMSEPEQEAVSKATPEEKWQLVLNQRARSPVLPLQHYLNSLRRQTADTPKASHRFSWPRRQRDSSTSMLLSKLKADLKMAPHSFVQDFLFPPNDGMKLLVGILRDMQTSHSAYTTTKKAKKEELKHLLADEYDCLLCIRFACRVQDSLQRLLQLNGALDSIGQCLISDMFKSRVIALQILEEVCDMPGGFGSVMNLMSSLRLRYGENVRFKLLMGALNSCGHAQLNFMTACVSFLNKLVACSESSNAIVYLQYELKLAGFDPTELEKYSYGTGFDSQELRLQLEKWRQNYIDVQGHQAVLVSSERRSQLLREEVNRLQDKLKKFERDVRHLEKDLKSEHEKCDHYRERAAELQDTVTKLNRVYRRQAGPAVWEIAREVPLTDALKPLDYPETENVTLSRKSSSASIASCLNVVTDTSRAVSPPPIPPPPPNLTNTVRVKVLTHANMPALNWFPLNDVTGTIFQGIDFDRSFRDIDFADFEARFKLPGNQQKEGKRKRSAFTIQPDPALISFVAANRARNMGITKRKTGLNNEQIEEAINLCQVDVLSGEAAELLIKFIPTREELIALERHRGEEERLGEPEKFVHMLSRIDRLETKLRLLAYMGQLDELVDAVKPQLLKVIDASNSVLKSEKLKKIFEITLAFGNYMNSPRRGHAYGFYLESLYKLIDVKSTCRRQTLLHYMVDLISKKYPELLDFADHLDVDVPKGVSYQALSSDILELRKGTDLARSECERQPENTSLEQFSQRSSLLVAEVAELFKRMEDAYKDVAHLFGENFKLTEPDDLFKVLSDFVSNFQIALSDNRMRSQGHSQAGFGLTVNYGTLPTSPVSRVQKSSLPESHFHVQSSPRLGRYSNAESPSLAGLSSLPPTVTLSVPPNDGGIDRTSLGGMLGESSTDEQPTTTEPAPQKLIFQNVLRELSRKKSRSCTSIDSAVVVKSTPDSGSVADEDQIPGDAGDAEHTVDGPAISDNDGGVSNEPSGTCDITMALDKLDQVVFEAEFYGDDAFVPSEDESTSL